MHRHLLTLLIIVASAASPLRGTTQYASYAFGKQYVVEITGEALARSPAWKDDAENPPLSARKAIALATELKDTLVKDSADYTWRLERASLTPDEAGKWYWLIDYIAQFRGSSTGMPHSLRLVVLMDGTVVKPVVKEGR